MTVNIRGLGNATAQADLADMITAAGNPDVVVLTETKRRKKPALRPDIHKRYTTIHSMTATGNAGVTILLNHHFKTIDAVSLPDVPHTCRGYILHCSLQPRFSSAIHIVGVYLPNDDAYKQHRSDIYMHLSSLLNNLHHDHSVVLTGDWNACLLPSDRTGMLTPTDRRHVTWTQQHPDLQSVFSAHGNRCHTFKGHDGTSSMLDDTLLLPPRGTHHRALVTECSVNNTHGYATDHAVLTCDIDMTAAGLEVPTQPPSRQTRPPGKRLRTPVTLASQQRVQTRVEEKGSGRMARTEARLDAAHQCLHEFRKQLATSNATSVQRLDTIQGRPSRHEVNEIAREVTDFIDDAAVHIVPEECETYMTNPSGIHYRPKAKKNRRNKLVKGRKRLRALLAQAQAEPAFETEQQLQAAVQQLALGLPPADKEQLEEKKHLEPTQQAAWLLTRLHAAIQKLDYADHRLDAQRRRQQYRHTVATRPKVAFRQVRSAGSDKQQERLVAVADPVTGRPTTDAATVVHAVDQHFRPKLAAPDGAKTGLYLPHDVPRDYPWTQPGAQDCFKLQTDATLQPNRQWLLDHLDERVVFDCCKRLGNGKAPGPDDVVNEVIKMMPPRVKKMIHKLFVIMWATGCTPDKWKHSHTRLIHKKGTAMDIGNYRPIALANTMYKLWTSCVQQVLNEYAEAHRILSAAQSGFRQRTSRAVPIQMLQMAIEDAELSQQDLYTMQVDFSSAFNTIDQDRLLMVMYDLGFPTDAVEVVKDLYDGATTSYVTDYGPTAPISVERGTLQGDTLSPFLFLIYLEPLLRWLNVGGRGHTFGCVPSEKRNETRCNSLAYADDLEILASSRSNLLIQASKLSTYSDWARMQVNAGKTFVSGILHRTGQGGGGASKLRDMTAALKKQLADVTVQGQPVVFLAPDQPFTYLGIEMTLTISWHHQYRKVLGRVRDLSRALYHNMATSGQKINMINTLVRPTITNTFMVAAYTALQIRTLDGLVAGMVKRAYKLPRSAPTAMVMEDTAKFGMGCPSLLVDYMQAKVKYLTEAVNHPSSYGTISLYLLRQQARTLGNLDDIQLGTYAGRYLRVRQLSAVKHSDLQLVKLQDGDNGRELLLQDSSMVKIMKHMQGRADAPATQQRCCKILMPLVVMGATEIADVVSADGKMVLSIQDLRRKYGAHAVGQNQARALYKLAHMLHNEQPVGKLNHTQLTRAYVEQHGIRHVAATHRPLITSITDNQQQPLLKKVLAPKHTRPPTTLPDTLARAKALPAPAAPAACTLLDLTQSSGKRRRHDAAAVGHRTALEPRDTAALGVGMARTRAAPRRKYLARSERVKLITGTLALAHADPDQAEKAMGVLPTCHFLLEYILSDRTCTTNTHDKARKVAETQRQYEVQWKPSLLERWALEAHIAVGYEIEGTPKLTTMAELEAARAEYAQVLDSQPTTDEGKQQRAYKLQLAELYEANRCEMCNDTDDAADNPMYDCDGCHRMYHAKCMGLGKLLGTDDPFTCECCCHGTEDHQNRELLVVTWKPRWEPASVLDHDTEAAPYLAKKAQLQSQPAPQAPRPDAHLSELQRQGVYGPNRHINPLTDEARRRIHIEHQPINPHTDIMPCHEYRVEVRNVQRWAPRAGDPLGCCADYDAACVYGPDGRSVLEVSPARLHALHNNYCQVVSQQPHLCQRLGCSTFAEEMYKLAMRYRKAAGGTATGQGTGKTAWTIPTEIWEVQSKYMVVFHPCWAALQRFHP
jgi:exonuclease III